MLLSEHLAHLTVSVDSASSTHMSGRYYGTRALVRTYYFLLVRLFLHD